MQTRELLGQSEETVGVIARTATYATRNNDPEKIVRFAIVSLASLLAMSAATAAHAEVPNPIAALLGPSVGYLLFESDLCGWGLTDKIKKTYQDGFKTIGMTAAQQTTAWQQAADTQQRMAGIPPDAKANMKADTCTAAAREHVEHDLAN
jgi:hypothetical protein